MRHLITIFLAGTVSLCFTACKKDYNTPSSLANIYVVNAIVNVPTILVNSAGRDNVWLSLSGPTSYTTKIGYGSSLGNTFTAGPAAMKIVSAADTTTYLYKAPGFATQPGDIYTLFLAGSATAVDAVLQKEQLVRPADSTTAIRFINLVSNSTPVNFYIKNAATAEVTNLAYKQLSDFKVYDAHKANASYVFEARDANNTLLASYTFAVARTNNVTLALRGFAGSTGTNAPTFSRVNHY